MSPVLFSCRPFPAAFVIHVLNMRVHLDAQLDFESEAEARTKEDSLSRLQPMRDGLLEVEYE